MIVKLMSPPQLTLPVVDEGIQPTETKSESLASCVKEAAQRKVWLTTSFSNKANEPYIRFRWWIGMIGAGAVF